MGFYFRWFIFYCPFTLSLSSYRYCLVICCWTSIFHPVKNGLILELKKLKFYICFKASLKFKADESGICKPRNRVSKLKITLLVFSESQPSVFWLCFADKNFQRVLSTLPNNACFINKLNSSLQRPRADLELPCSYITAMEC